MSMIILFFIVFVSCFSFAQMTITPLPPEAQLVRIAHDPTDQNIVSPDEVLIVSRSNDTSSTNLANTFRTIHNIPEVNSVPLSIPDNDPTSFNHPVGLYFQGEVISDQSPASPPNGTNDSWRFFKKYMYDPLAVYLLTHYSSDGILLKNKIKYIVMMKGTPHKITPYGEWSGTDDIRLTYVSTDALLCLLFQDDIPNFDILSLFGHSFYNQHNPYFNADLTYEGKYRFKQNYFTDYYNQKLCYLVSRIGGVNQQEAYDVMNRNLNPDRSGNNKFVLDSYIQWSSDLPAGLYGAKVRLTQLGYNFQYDSSANVLNSSDRIIGYASAGVYAGMSTNYPYALNGNFKNGSIANTYESFSAFFVDSVDKADRRAGGQPVISEFIDVNFSGGPGNAYEPTVSSLPQDSILFPAYAAGYNMVDAAYMSMPYMAYRNVVFGDPFVTISYGKQSLQNNITLSDTTLFMGEVTIPSGKMLTIQNNSTIKFRHLGFITGSGVLNIGSNVTINTNSWSRSVLLCNSANNPRLVWAVHPSFSTSFYKVYRAVSNTPVSDPSTLTFELRYTSPDASTFSFTDNEIMIGSGQYFYYYVTANRVRTPKPPIESDISNYTTIRGGMYKKGNTEEEPLTKNLSFSLDQNYPNPFNPATMIKYQLQKNGNVTLKVFDILGNELKTLVNEFKEKGEYTVQFDASLLPSGMYVYQIKANDYIATKKMLLVK